MVALRGSRLACSEEEVEITETVLAELSRILFRERRKHARERKAGLLAEAWEAWGRGRPAEAMGAARAAARCRCGPSRRDGRLARTALPSAPGWAEAL
eukprot:862997-Pyramimonas_sp.AAC.1